MREGDDDDLERLPDTGGNGKDQPPVDPGADERSDTPSGGDGQGGK